MKIDWTPNSVAGAMSRNAEDEDFKRVVFHYIEELKKIPKGADRAHSIHCLLDDELEEQKKQEIYSKVQCKKGCCHCCSVMVAVSEDEADLLKRCITEDKVKINENRLKIQSKIGDSSGNWWKLKFNHRKCVFLGEDGSCQVYKYRPMACRSYLVISDPKYCDYKVGVQRVQLLNSKHIDAIMTAAYFVDGNPGPMSIKLYERLKDKRK